jgi:hypothetical protein
MRLFPKIKKCDDLPQWIISSDRAAYHPHSRTIYLTSYRYLMHELGHWVIDIFGGRKRAQNFYDNFFEKKEDI